MPFDSLVANAGRLRILVALASADARDFVELRRDTRLTDGNLSAHARRLHSAGLVAVQKSFRQGKPVTTFRLTPAGRQALAEHVRVVQTAIAAPPLQPVLTGADEDWVD